MGPGRNDAGASGGHIMDAVEASLRRLDTDHIDLYQIHATDALTPVEETVRALDHLVRQGKVRYVGVSNWQAWRIATALGISARSGLTRFATLQGYYSVAGRDIEREIGPLLEAEKVGLLVWSPLAGGLLSGKYRRDNQTPEGSRRSTFDFPIVDKERAWDVIDVLARIAEAHGCSPARIALAWLLAKPIVTSVIIGARRLGQLEDNLAAADIALTDEEVRQLDRVSDLAPEYPGSMVALQGGDRLQTPVIVAQSRRGPAAGSAAMRWRSARSTGYRRPAAPYGGPPRPRGRVAPPTRSLHAGFATSGDVTPRDRSHRASPRDPHRAPPDEIRDEVEEHADAGRRHAGRVVVGVEREGLVGPVGQHLHEPAVAQVVARVDLQQLREPLPAQTRAEEGARAVDRELAGRPNAHDLGAPDELPRERVTRGRIAQEHALVAGRVAGWAAGRVAGRVARGELARVRRRAAAPEVVRRRAGEHTRVQQPAPDQRRGLWLAEPDGHVEAVGHQVAHAVAHREFDGQVWVPREQRPEARREHEVAERLVDVDPEPPAHRGARAARRGRGVLDRRQVRRDRLVEPAPLVGERDRARGAVEDAHADAGLEPRDGATHRRLREA
jgi:aryl-alcohol dehydrogenase-like predicted oxidoreductase